MSLEPHTSLDHVDFAIAPKGLLLFARHRALTIPLYHISTIRILQFASNLGTVSLSSIRVNALREVRGAVDHGVLAIWNRQVQQFQRQESTSTALRLQNIFSQLFLYWS
jgi:hypothetical protein